MRKTIVLALSSLLLAVGTAAAQDAVIPQVPLGSQYQWQEVATGLARPLLLTNAADGSNRMFIVEQAGYIWVLENGQVLKQPFLDVSGLVSRDANERGLLGLAFHADFETNRQFYINYTDVNGNTVVARYTALEANLNVADPSSATFIIQIDQPYPNHNGGDLAFGPDGYLYIGMGDGGSQGDPQRNGQNPQALLGKMLRLDVDSAEPYAAPPDNPYATDPNIAPEVWAMGLRNPWRFSFDRLTDDLYIADVGQNQWEEINFQPAGQGGVNYGWNIMEASARYSGEPVQDGLTPPVAEYTHAEGGCSVTGGYVYRGTELPALNGVYLFGDYCSGLIWSTFRDADGAWRTNLFMDTDFSISSFGEDEAGELYLVNQGGTILKLVRA
ncbi:MAG: PQQ-dependent sugar dehydrogenase [Chloroflexi bacterium]|nr:PQQ-dependent sugar dehydrogenase [Chloroflexota bacterium]MCC6892105.1 PQQ-dependent sugar dehydrogenase [Anaerolineae bacterium]